MKAKVMVLAADGSFCNRRVFGAAWDRTTIVARARKDAVLCFPAAAASRRFYAAETFTPEQVRQNESIPWQKTRVYFGGKRRTLRYKLVSGVLWRGGAWRCKLRLLVVAPTPYRNRKRGRWLYRRAAYLLTSELEATAPRLLQIYLDRWQIEVNHREEKDTLGVGQAQLWNEKAVPRQPALMVAAYSALLLAGLQAYGPHRGQVSGELPRWRRKQQRPSCQDLVTLLRQQAHEQPHLLLPFGIRASYQRSTLAAAS